MLRTKRNTAQTSTPTTFVSRSAPQAHPIFLIKPIQYPTPNNPHLNQPATVIRPILSSNINIPIARPPLVRRLLRPTIIRPLPPRLIANDNKNLSTTEPVTIRTSTPINESSIESSLSTSISTISSNSDENEKEKSYCDCLPCCRSKDKSIKTPENNTRTVHNYPNLKLKSRTIYIILVVLFIFFLIVIVLLIVLIVVRR